MTPSEPVAPSAPSAQASATELLRHLMQLTRAYASDALALLRAEWRDHARSLRTVMVMSAAALVLGSLALILLSLALVALIAFALGSWGWSLLIVGVAYLIVGGLLTLPIRNRARSGMLQFRHTRDRLRRDAEWVKHRFAA